jgi:glycosyltransferase 2 family protein
LPDDPQSSSTEVSVLLTRHTVYFQTDLPDHHMAQFQFNQGRWWLWAIKLMVVVAVCIFVSGTFRSAIGTLAERPWQIHPPWLVAAGLLYLAGVMPMAWFWWRVLAALGQRPGWWTTLHAYFLGHLGKYVPGKALVVVIRVGLLRPWVRSVRLAFASVLLETLTLMAAGAALGAALSGFVLHLDRRITMMAVAMAIVAGVPTLPAVARRLAGKAAADFRQVLAHQELSVDTTAAMRLGITYPLLAAGWLAAVVCWTLWGLSLWATLRGIGSDVLQPATDLPLLAAAVSLAVVGGFVSMLPGGLVVRDALLLELLSPSCGSANALVASVMLRLVWLVSELGICGILELVRRFNKPTIETSVDE